MSQLYSKLKTKNHSAYRLYYHLVLSTKYRHKCITGEMLERLEEIFKELLIKWDSSLVEFGGESDHIHCLFETEPTVQLASLVKNLKSVSSRKIRQEYSEHLKSFYWKRCDPGDFQSPKERAPRQNYFWNRAYCIISVGGRANIKTLLKYIENQDSPARLKPPLTSDSPTVES
ncbi:MAG: IS200/IS605 family transposase [Xenococcus sp. (in: cyanobacteria)]